MEKEILKELKKTNELLKTMDESLRVLTGSFMEVHKEELDLED